MYRGDVRAFVTSLRRPDTILALAAAFFVLTWPLEKRHLVFTAYSFVTGAYTEAGTLALYISDIAFIVLGACWIRGTMHALRKPRTETPWSFPITPATFWFGVAFVCWAAFRALPPTPGALGWYSALRTAQGLLLFLMTADLWRVPRVRTAIVSTFLLVGVLQALLGSVQVLNGGDLGLTFLGEQRLSLENPGVAKVDLETNVSSGTGKVDLETNVSSGTRKVSTIETVEHVNIEPNSPLETKILRAYGTFPHPNVLGSFLALVILYELYLLNSQVNQIHVRNRLIPSIMLLLTHTGAILTFSRSSWLSIILLTLGSFCSYRNIKRARNFVPLIAASGIIILTFSSIVPLGTAVYRRFLPLKSDMFLQERMEFLRETASVIQKKPHIGVGTGNGLVSLVQANKSLDNSGINVITHTLKHPWQYQYPHSVPVVIVLELGLIGLVLAGSFVFLILMQPVCAMILQDRRWGLGRFVLLSFAALSPLLFDHFLWTTQQGRILLWGLLGVLASAQLSTRGVAAQAVRHVHPATR